jgi:hypothetical protein
MTPGAVLPLSFAVATRSKDPVTRRTGRGNLTVVSHTETIGEIVGSGNYQVQEFTINPGEATVFPWLEQQSAAWEYYRFRSLEFIYTPIVSVQNNGVLLMAVEYAAGTPPPPDLKSIMAYHKAVNSPVYRKVSMPLDISAAFPAGGYKYVRHQTQPTDRKLYDAGVLMLATQGAAAQSMGLLSVRYVIEFKTPQLEKPLAPADGVMFVAKNGNQQIADGTAGQADYRANATWPANFDIGTIDGLIRKNLVSGGQSFVFPPGTYEFKSDVGVLSNLLAAAPSSEEVEVKLGRWNDNTETFTPFDAPSLSATSSEMPNPLAYNRVYNMVNSTIQFFNEPTEVVLRTLAFLGAATTGGILRLNAGSNLAVRSLTSTGGL